MNVAVTAPLDRKRWLASLQSGKDVSDTLKEQMDLAEEQLFKAAMPKAVYRIMKKEDIRRKGVSIEKHLEECDRVAVMGATLGMGVDDLIRRTQVRDMVMAVILDCGASLMIEEVCDIFQKQIDAETDGYLTSRFSPGYGDYPLEYQQIIVRYIDGQRKIGLNVTANSLMVPRKSVTALLGISDHPVTGRLATCGECVLREKCTLRKEGKFCGD